MRKLALILLPGIAVLGFLWWNTASQPASTTYPRAEAPAPLPVLPDAPAPDTAPARNTGKDFALYVGLKAEFDAFIFGQQPAQTDALRAAYASALTKTEYTDSAQQALLSLFTRYLNYKTQLQAIDTPDTRHHLAAIADRLDARDQLRYQYFSEEEYHYLFSQDSAYDEAALTRLRIAQDDALSRQQKHALINAQLSTLPESQQRSFAPSLAVNRLNDITQQFASGNTQYQAVAAEFGHEVAHRLQQRQSAQDTWKERVAAFAAWKATVESDDTIDQADKTSRIDARLNREFNDNEARRLQVFLENPALLGPSSGR